MNKLTKKRLYDVVRTFTGLLFIFISGSKFGLLPNGLSRPEMFTSEGWAFISAIDASGYLFPTIGIVSFLCGLAFLTNRYVALAAALLVPITLNFSLFHIFLGLPVDSVSLFFREAIAFVVLGLNLYILYMNRAKYKALLK